MAIEIYLSDTFFLLHMGKAVSIDLIEGMGHSSSETS
jgi:hypothetical protein